MLCYPGGLPPCDFDRVDASSSLNLIRQKCLALAVVDARHKQLSIPGHQITGADELVKCHLVHGEPVIAAVDQALDQPDLIAEVVGVDFFSARSRYSLIADDRSLKRRLRAILASSHGD
jgi:hypothetical protein